MKIATPWKNHHPQKSWGPVKLPPFFKNLVGGSTPLPPAEWGGGGFHNMKCCTRSVTKVLRFGSMIKLDNILERKYLNDKLAAFYCKLIQENFIKNQNHILRKIKLVISLNWQFFRLQDFQTWKLESPGNILTEFTSYRKMIKN